MNAVEENITDYDRMVQMETKIQTSEDLMSYIPLPKRLSGPQDPVFIRLAFATGLVTDHERYFNR